MSKYFDALFFASMGLVIVGMWCFDWRIAMVLAGIAGMILTWLRIDPE